MNLNINQITLAWLNSINGIGNRTIDKMLDYFQSPKDLWYNFEAESYNLKLKPEILNSLLNTKDNFEYNLIKNLTRNNARITTYFDDDYPKKLRNIQGFPYLLYYKGNLDCSKNITIAVIGSRKATSYGMWTAEKFTRELSELNVTIVSGLATGIDTIAHKTALKYKAKTIGVIGCGIDVVYPKKSEVLYDEIIDEDGCVVTEFTFGMEPISLNFPVRNRIISGLSDGVLVIEAQEKSGTLITASHAADQGKEIFAVPGNIDSLYSKGTNSLIKDGAKIVTCIDDIIEELIELKSMVSKNKNKNILNSNNLNEQELNIVNFLKSGEKSITDIEDNINMNISEILSSLTVLEMKGVVKQIEGKKYILNI